MRPALVILAAASLAACSSGPRLETRAADPGDARFDGRALVVVSDVDMPGTGYADGVLKPLAGERDAVTVLSPASAQTGPSVVASNSVMGWPGAVDLSPDGRFAYVVETRGPAPEGVAALEGGVWTGMPEGRFLTAIDITDPAAPRVLGSLEVGADPTAVHVAPDGRFLIVSRKDAQAPLAIVMLDGGAPGRLIPIAFPSPVKAERPIDDGALFVRLAPNGRDFVVNFANTHLQFGRLDLGANGAPASASAVGGPVAAGKWLAMARWSADGRHALVVDTGWSESPLGAVLNAPGAIVSVAFDAGGAHRIAAREVTSLGPEGFEFDRTGGLLAVVNMERTYLPERLPYQLFGRRAQSSLSLLAFDAASGGLRTVDGPVAFDGVLPEDAMFDADGDMLAIAVFHGKEDAPKAGWLQYFRIDRSAGAPRAIPAGRSADLPRGAHDLALAP